MQEKNAIDIRLAVKDIFFTPNDYRLDDTYVIKGKGKHPFALLCPGGAYSKVCSFIEGVPIAKELNKMGISAFILYYHVKKKAAYPAPQNDLARAVKEIMENAEKYEVETENYSIWGSSAGGHLAASFGTEHMGYQKYSLAKPAALVLSYPVISMKKSLTHKGSHDALLGKDPSLEQEEAASIEKHVTENYPRTFIWCGDADKAVSPDNTKRMVEALKKAGVSCEAHIYPKVGHGVGTGIGSTAEEWISKAVKFWLA